MIGVTGRLIPRLAGKFIQVHAAKAVITAIFRYDRIAYEAVGIVPDFNMQPYNMIYPPSSWAVVESQVSALNKRLAAHVEAMGTNSFGFGAMETQKIT